MSNNYKFTKIDRIIKITAKNYKLDNAFYKHKLVKGWQAIVQSYVSEAAGELSRAVDFKKGVLLVACLSKEVAYQIRLLSKRIIAALNQYLGANAVFALSTEF